MDALVFGAVFATIVMGLILLAEKLATWTKPDDHD